MNSDILRGRGGRGGLSLLSPLKATATRDLQHRASLGALFPLGGDRSPCYELAIR